MVCVERVRLLNDIPGGRLPLSVHMPTRLTFDVSQAGPGKLLYNLSMKITNIYLFSYALMSLSIFKIPWHVLFLFCYQIYTGIKKTSPQWKHTYCL